MSNQNDHVRRTHKEADAEEAATSVVVTLAVVDDDDEVEPLEVPVTEALPLAAADVDEGVMVIPWRGWRAGDCGSQHKLFLLLRGVNDEKNLAQQGNFVVHRKESLLTYCAQKYSP